MMMGGAVERWDERAEHRAYIHRKTSSIVPWTAWTGRVTERRSTGQALDGFDEVKQLKASRSGPWPTTPLIWQGEAAIMTMPVDHEDETWPWGPAIPTNILEGETDSYRARLERRTAVRLTKGSIAPRIGHDQDDERGEFIS